jgi:hypothetical protein
MSYAVGQHVHETGIRMALGARRRRAQLVLHSGLSLALLGIAIRLNGSGVAYGRDEESALSC